MAVWDVGFVVGAILIWFVHSHPVGFFWSTLLSSCISQNATTQRRVMCALKENH